MNSGADCTAVCHISVFWGFYLVSPDEWWDSTARSLTYRNAHVAGPLFAARVSWFICFYGEILDSHRENLAAPGCESCSSAGNRGVIGVSVNH
jgi:hypothetical protein